MTLLDTWSHLNWSAIGVAAIASWFFGALWFAVIFPKAYATALGRSGEPRTKPALIFLIGPFVCGLIATIAQALLIDALDIRAVPDALTLGAVVGIGFLTSTAVNTGINPNIPRPLFYGLISGTYFFLWSLLVSVILVAFR